MKWFLKNCIALCMFFFFFFLALYRNLKRASFVRNFLKFVIFLVALSVIFSRILLPMSKQITAKLMETYQIYSGKYFFPKNLESIFALQYLLKVITFTFKACWWEEISSEHYKAEDFCPTGYWRLWVLQPAVEDRGSARQLPCWPAAHDNRK